MSFPWDGRYALILRGWTSPAGSQPCAMEPFSQLGDARAVETFDSVQFISDEDYTLIPEPEEPKTLVHTPESRRYEAVVHRLELKTVALRKFLERAGT